MNFQESLLNFCSREKLLPKEKINRVKKIQKNQRGFEEFKRTR